MSETKTQTLNISPIDLREGDEFYHPDGSLYWTAVDNAVESDEYADHAMARVQFSDGGVDPRHWDIENRLTVERDVA